MDRPDSKDAATPRPWRARRTGGGFAITYGTPGMNLVRVAFCESDPDPVMDAQTEADANLIERAVNSHDALVKALRDVSAAADALEKANDGKCALCGESAKKGHADDCRLLPFFVAENTLDALALALAKAEGK